MTTITDLEVSADDGGQPRACDVPAPNGAAAPRADDPHRAATTRLSIIESARECMKRAFSLAIRPDTKPASLYACDDSFKHLAGCVSEYVRILRAMGESADRIHALLFEALREAVAPEEPHPAIAAAVLSWGNDPGI